MVGVTTKQTKEDAVQQENDAVDADQQEPFDLAEEKQEPLAPFTRLGALRISDSVETSASPKLLTLSSCTINLLSFSTSVSMARHHCLLSHVLTIYSRK